MRNNLFQFGLALAVILGFINGVAKAADGWPDDNDHMVYLREGWTVLPNSAVTNDFKILSSASESAAKGHPASVPETVLASLVGDGVYKDIFVGTNLAAIPTNQFTTSWWYRRDIDVTADQAAECATLIFEGINYRANIWLNGEKVAGEDKIFGAFRIFKLDVSGHLKAGKNFLAVEIIPPKPGDFTMGFVDWNPKPPDKNMGLFRPVKLHFYKTVAVDNVFVESKIDHESWRRAQLTVNADVMNHSDQAVQAVLKGEVDGRRFKELVSLRAHEERHVVLGADQHPELQFDNARLWWPWELGKPNLYTLKLNCDCVGAVSDETQTRFGIREVSDYVNADGYRAYKVNGKRVLIRGGGWADELLLREDETNLTTQIHYTRDMNLNTIRLEGIWGSSQRLYDLADENGLLVMVGWSCEWEWGNYFGGKENPKFGAFSTEPEMDLATNYLHDQVYWLRNHPAIYVWVLGSDKLPYPAVETRYDALMAIIDPTRPTLKSCGGGTSPVSGPSRVKMEGPYDYVTPNYWYLDRTHGGAYGFNTETGPGPQPPPLESLKKMFTGDELWPIGSAWKFHCGRGEFGNINRYVRAFNARYGEANGVEDFASRSQAANYEAIRPMYEAFSANLPKTAGIIQWMLNPSWPKLYWQLYDYYLLPGGAYFGAKKGAAPIAAVYNYGDGGVYLVNQVDNDSGELATAITVYDSNSQKIFTTNLTAASPVYGAKKLFDLHTVTLPVPVYFLELQVTKTSGQGIGENFYWLSTKEDVLDEKKSTWYDTPNTSFADFTSLNQLPKAHITSDVTYTPTAGGVDAEVTLSNADSHLAFFIEMAIVGATSHETLVPVIWTDNYVSLPPGAKRVYRAHIPTLASGEKPELRVRGWNLN